MFHYSGIIRVINMIRILMRFERSQPIPVKRMSRGLGIIVMLTLTGCSPLTARPSATATLTTSSPETNTPIPAVPQVPPALGSCADLPNGTSLFISNLDFPEDGIATATIVTPSTTPMEVIAYVACTSDLKHPQNLAPWQRVTQIIDTANRGWQVATRFPLDGTHVQQCTPKQHCYSASPQDFLLIDQVVVLPSHQLAFLLLKAGPQPLVRCDPALFPYDVTPPSISPVFAAEIPLPPLTRISTGFGLTGGANVRTYLCTAGTAQSIEGFMQKQLPLNDWVATQVNGRAAWKTTSDPTLYLFIATITDPSRWYIDEYSQI